MENFIKRKRKIQHAPYKHAGATPKKDMNRKLRDMKREIDMGQWESGKKNTRKEERFVKRMLYPMLDD